MVWRERIGLVLFDAPPGERERGQRGKGRANAAVLDALKCNIEPMAGMRESSLR